jgi:hypothetical protein
MSGKEKYFSTHRRNNSTVHIFLVVVGRLQRVNKKNVKMFYLLLVFSFLSLLVCLREPQVLKKASTFPLDCVIFSNIQGSYLIADPPYLPNCFPNSDLAGGGGGGGLMDTDLKN